MTTTTTTAKGGRFARVVRLAGGRLLLTLERGRKADGYLVEEFAADWGRGFSLLNLSNAERYEANTSPPSCSCKGFSRWGTCKDCKSLAALAAAGRLDS